MQLSLKLIVAIILFVAFSIGLHLGVNGFFSFDNAKLSSNVPSMEQFKKPTLEFPIITQTHKIQSTGSLNESKVPSTNLQVVVPYPSTLITIKPVMTLAYKLRMVEKLISLKMKEKSKVVNVADEKITAYINGNQNIPIVLLTCNRPQLLKNTLISLLNVRGVTKDQIIISQDGNMKEVAELAREYEIHLIQNIDDNKLRSRDGGSRIAMHYKYSLSAAFDRYPTAPALIVVEDDLLFSPDFYEYFRAVAPVLDEDPSTFVVSAWSDNGFKGRVMDKYALRRTDYFPGLGWMLTRRLYKSELEAQWPREHWDHWLRSAVINKNREIVFPQVPRSFHNGIKGTFMNEETHNRYFRDIDYNTDPAVSWAVDSSSGALVADSSQQGPSYMQADSGVYEFRVEQLVQQCKHVNDVQDLLKWTGEVLCLWIDLNPVSEWQPPEFQPVAEFFGLWHEHRRGSHRGLHEFYFEGNYIMLFNTYGGRGSGGIDRSRGADTYKLLRPPSAHTLDPKSFDKSLLLGLRSKGVKIDTHKASEPGLSCDQVCASVSRTCNAAHLQLLNTCETMQQHFGCETCKKSVGADQPAFVTPDADRQFGPGSCLVNAIPTHSLCEASHHATVRLCACSGA